MASCDLLTQLPLSILNLYYVNTYVFIRGCASVKNMVLACSTVMHILHDNYGYIIEILAMNQVYVTKGSGWSLAGPSDFKDLVLM